MTRRRFYALQVFLLSGFLFFIGLAVYWQAVPWPLAVAGTMYGVTMLAVAYFEPPRDVEDP